MRRSLLLGTFMLTMAAGCGGSDGSPESGPPAPQTSGAEKPANGADPAAGSAAQGLDQMMQGLQQMAQSGQQGAVTLVDYERLKTLMPELSGWERSAVKGQQVSMGMSVSRAEALYTRGNQSMKLEVIDTSLSQMMLAPFMMFARAGYEERSDDGYKKGITLASYPGFESWDQNGKDAEVHLLVGKRFLVNVDANDVESPDPARALIQAVDLGKLAGMQ